MNPTALMMLFSSLAIGTSITLLSYHWLLAWIGLEINTLAIIPIMMKTPHPRAVEAATKYFLTQATASALILFSSTTNAWYTGEWTMNSLTELPAYALSIAIMTKLGLAPLHLWLPEVMQGIPLFTGLILSTWQKIAPMALLIQTSNLLNLNLMMIIGFASVLIGGLGGISQTQLRKMMAFSSIGHLGWMIVILKLNPQLTLFNFSIYILMTTSMFLSLMSLSATKMSQISVSWSKSPDMTATIMLIILSLAGLPPLTGFAPKLLIILELTKQDATLMAAMITLISLLALFFYIRLSYVTSLTMTPNTPQYFSAWRTSVKFSPMNAMVNTLALFLLPLTPTILLLM
uniref:NADH-ubiquinone oxidoreductase chain 2 n=1 Tax=Huia cavitympanum TaxID=325565 RepID=D6BL67_9NEOB|nr:NADH dehydrogenase subunit 2 [Huia cavitympanum]